MNFYVRSSLLRPSFSSYIIWPVLWSMAKLVNTMCVCDYSITVGCDWTPFIRSLLCMFAYTQTGVFGLNSSIEKIMAMMTWNWIKKFLFTEFHITNKLDGIATVLSSFIIVHIINSNQSMVFVIGDHRKDTDDGLDLIRIGWPIVWYCVWDFVCFFV